MTVGAAEGWQGLLDPGERILWQGQPDSRIDIRDIEPRRSLFGLAILVFALFWSFSAMAALADGGPALIFLAAGMFFILLGAREAFGYLLIDAFTRSQTWYTLTDSRAFIATEFLGRRKLRSYPISGQTVLELTDGTPGSVTFTKTHMPSRRGSRRRMIGFHRIADARHVYDLMRRIQRGQA